MLPRLEFPAWRFFGCRVFIHSSLSARSLLECLLVKRHYNTYLEKALALHYSLATLGCTVGFEETARRLRAFLDQPSHLIG